MDLQIVFEKNIMKIEDLDLFFKALNNIQKMADDKGVTFEYKNNDFKMEGFNNNNIFINLCFDFYQLIPNNHLRTFFRKIYQN